MAHLTFIIGGARSGKSRHAQELAAQWAGGAAVLYVATGVAGDDEMVDRIRWHKDSRPAHWQTAEAPLETASVLRAEAPKYGVVLLDCLTFFVTNHMLGTNAHSADDTPEWNEQSAVTAVTDLIEAIEALESRVIVVSNEVGLGLVPENPLGRAFRDIAGRANQDFARTADTVILMVAGLPMYVKGQP